MNAVTQLLSKQKEAQAAVEKARRANPEAQALAELQAVEGELQRAQDAQAQAEYKAAVKAGRGEIDQLTKDAQALQAEIIGNMRAVQARAEELRARYHKLEALAGKYPELKMHNTRQPVGFVLDVAGNNARMLQNLEFIESLAVDPAEQSRQIAQADYKNLVAKLDGLKAELAEAKRIGADQQTRQVLEKRISGFSSAADSAKRRLDALAK